MIEYLKLKKSNCKNCYKCIRNCPVKSIRFSGNQAHIVGDECILCGHCFVVCPQNAKEIVDDTEKAKVLIQSGQPVVVSLAPSFIANYDGVGISSMDAALKKLGFVAVEETAIGATMVKNEYERILKDGAHDILISSCCPSVNLLIQKYYPDALKYLANIVSPMQAHCIDLKKRYPGAKTVFIGPCLSKKDEADRYEGIVDCVLTFEDLTNWLDAESIVLDKNKDQTAESRTRIFPTTGGILKTMVCDQPGYSYLAIDGVENCTAALEDILNGGLERCFVEMSACVGSCVGGPVMEKYHRSPIRDYSQVVTYAGKEDFEIDQVSAGEMIAAREYISLNRSLPGNAEIQAILVKMGKTKPEDELNCGSCGYNSCKEKAIAVYQGKADLSMCLPFLKEKAENFSDNIIQNTPNGIIVLNDELEVQQINDAARKIMNIRNASDVMGEQVICILDPTDFWDVRSSGKSIRNQKKYLAEYRKYVEQTIIYDKDYHILMCIMRDITDVEVELSKKETLNKQTIDIADKVVDKQMRVAQDIASLLGETVAETKIALARLKESIQNE